MIDKKRFPDELMTVYVSPRYRRLTTDFRYIDPVEGIIRCKAGLEIDGASFGRALSVLFGDQHDYDVPATPHDQLYEDNCVAGQYLTRDQCDKVFYRAMQYAGSLKRLPGLFIPESALAAGGPGGGIADAMRKSGRSAQNENPIAGHMRFIRRVYGLPTARRSSYGSNRGG